MTKWVIAVLAVSISAIVACGPTGTSEGDGCGGNSDDCGKDLTCQPIQGHGDVCCPTPPDSSKFQSCHAATK